MSAPLKILVVVNPGDQAELVSLLRTAGTPLSEARLVTGVGDDATFARFVAERPTLALVAATLDRGDSGSLIAAIREHAAPNPVFVVLIGDAKGPVQNALDALDIGADRFVGRPLTVKALRFAVVSGLGEAGAAWGGASSPAISVQALAAAALSAGPGDRRGLRLTPSMVPSVVPLASPERPVASVPMVAPVDDAAETQPLRVADLRSRLEALAEEIDEIPDDELDDRPTLRNLTAVPPPASSGAFDLYVDDGESGEIQVVEGDEVEDVEEDDVVGEDDVVVPVGETEVVAELEVGADGDGDGDGLVGLTTQAMPMEMFEPATEDALASAFAPMPVAAEAHLPEAMAIPEPAYAHEPVEAFEQAYGAVSAVLVPAAVAEAVGDGEAAAESELVFEPPAAEAEPAWSLESEPAWSGSEAAWLEPEPAWSSEPAASEPDSPFASPAEVEVPAVVAVQETASVVVIPESEVWPPPELHDDEPARAQREASSAVHDRAAAERDDRYHDPAPELPVREPTMVLTDDPPPFAPAGPPPSSLLPPPPTAPPPPPLLTTSRRSVTIPPPLPSASPLPSPPRSPTPAPIDDDVPFADDFDVVEDAGEGFGAADSFDREGEGPFTDSGAAPTPPPAAPQGHEPPPAGGEFARELRRKMSAMAERLFRGEVPAPVASGPGHDHHTEIDLRGLDEETPLPAAALTDDLGGATYVGELPGPDAHPTPSGTDGRGTSELGELRRGSADVPALVARMFAQSFTGRVVFRRAGVEKAIHFDGGRPVFATSNQLHDRMGELLHREGKITREQHDRCRDLVRDTGRRMGEILVERGYLKRRELLPAVRRHIEDIIYSLFAWDAGEYQVSAGDGAGNERIRLSRHAAAIILEGVRRKLDHDLLETLLGPPGTVVTIADRDKLAAVTAVADLSREERAALTALDGVADLDQVARASGAGLETVYQLAWSLSLLGLVAPRRRDEDGEGGALVGESDLRIDRERVQARCELCADADYFTLLGVRRDATGFEIRRAYEAARRDFAPDSFPAELRRELAADLDDIAQVLDEAYRVLRDDPLRSAYRSHLLEP